jgi:hypothetical protein
MTSSLIYSPVKPDRFSTSKLYFLTGLPPVRQVPDGLCRGTVPVQDGGSVSVIHQLRASYKMENSIEGRIIRYLRRVKPKEFTAADIAKKLDLTTRSVAAILKFIPEVRVKSRRQKARTESGNRYSFHKLKGGWP